MTDPTSAAAAPRPNLLERLGWRAERRPEPGFAHVLAAGGGAFVVFAVAAVISEIGGDDLTLPGVLLSLLVVAAAYAAGMRVESGPVRSAAVTAIVLATPMVWFFVFFGDGGGSDSTGVYLLTIASYAAFYVLGWTRGRAVFLGLGLLFLFGWITSEAQGSDGSVIPFQSTLDSQGSTALDSTPLGDSSSFSQPDTTTASIIALVLGVGALVIGAFLDRRKQHGIATPFIAVGALYAIIGATALGSDESALAGGLLAAGAGVVVGLVGGLGPHRRGSTWVGVLTVVIGLLVVIADLAGDSVLGFAGLAAVVAAALIALGLLLAPRLDEAPDGDEGTATTGATA